MTGNAGLQIDLALFGEAHLYHGEGMAFDPEGLLSTLPAFANVIAGYALGKHLQQKGSAADTVIKILSLAPWPAVWPSSGILPSPLTRNCGPLLLCF